MMYSYRTTACAQLYDTQRRCGTNFRDSGWPRWNAKQRLVVRNAKMHKLTNMEAQRVISVLEDAVERLSLISLIPITPNHVLFTHIDDAVLTGATRQLWQIEERRKRK